VSESCHICALYADRARHIYDDGPWFAGAVADVPGWVMLGTKEHLEGTASLSAEDAAGLGPALRAVGRAVQQATGAERVHMVFLGEAARHFHLAYFPRAAGEPALFDNGRLLETVKTASDAGRAAAVTEQLRSLLAGELRP
jgi:diadenosine tetraphosphate (Ap4A) HIT family hydrolase